MVIRRMSALRIFQSMALAAAARISITTCPLLGGKLGFL
jgi:hypothetical protein